MWLATVCVRHRAREETSWEVATAVPYRQATSMWDNNGRNLANGDSAYGLSRSNVFYKLVHDVW